MAALPASIGRYQPVALLGAGAMGSVFRAHDPLIDRMVAIKVVRADALDPATRTAFVERFRQEVQAAGRCSHPAIVGIYDFVEGDGDPSIIMELVEGRTLQQILREGAAVPVVPLLLQVLEGLGCAHGQGIIHRDIKPANIIVTPSGQAKIADFGIARLNEAVLTQAGTMVGTPHYMAPEQVTDDAVDARADLFAVGAILYEALAGRPPFAGRTIAETIQRLAGPAPVDLTGVRDRGCIPVLQRALAKDRGQRFPTAAAFASALQAATDPGQATVVPGAAAQRTAVGQRWDPALLARVERQLAVYLGPMARLVVTQATQEAASTQDLYAALTRSLPRAADRSAFLRALGGARVEPSLTMANRVGPAMTAPARAVAAPGGAVPGGGVPGGAVAGGAVPGGAVPGGAVPGGAVPGGAVPGGAVPGGAVPGGAVPNGAVPAEAVAAAQAALAFFVGPIARVLVRDAAAQARSGRDFIERLCAHVPKPDEQALLRRRLRAEVEGLLRPV
jgi:serine/threonine-protein kinase